MADSRTPMLTTTGGFHLVDPSLVQIPPQAQLAELSMAGSTSFLPASVFVIPSARDATVDFDAPHDLLMVETSDALGNRVTVEANDYRVLQPRLLS